MSKPKHGLIKGQKLTVSIASMAAGGQAVCKHNGLAIFVDRAVPGDRLEIELYDVRKDFALAKVSRVLEASRMRQEAPCKLFKVCGGCQWQHIDYTAQTELKTDIVRQVVERIGSLDPGLVQAAIAAPESTHYRNKVQYPVSSPGNSSRILAGYYKQGSHELVNIKHCPVQPEALDQLIENTKQIAERLGITAYNEGLHSGLLRHIACRYSFSEKESLLTLVLNLSEQSPGFESSEEIFVSLANELMSLHPFLKGVCLNFNDQKGNRIMGKQSKLIAGSGFITERLQSRHPRASQRLKQGIDFQISPDSFFQVNSAQAVTLMDQVLDAVLEYMSAKGLEKLPTIIDAYAGVASIAIWLADLADEVIALEQVDEAVADARRILQVNQIGNVECRSGTVESLLPALLESGKKADILILDPPRKGVEKSALLCAAKLKPERIVYVSCNPSTLARDLRILAEESYETRSIQVIDLFPQTYHVECIAIIDRNENSN